MIFVHVTLVFHLFANATVQHSRQILEQVQGSGCAKLAPRNWKQPHDGVRPFGHSYQIVGALTLFYDHIQGCGIGFWG